MILFCNQVFCLPYQVFLLFDIASYTVAIYNFDDTVYIRRYVSVQNSTKLKLMFCSVTGHITGYIAISRENKGIIMLSVWIKLVVLKAFV